ncbi:uncharacterized protein LOC143203124 [Rhynchophorus ferrugineus]|uniref:uncharacterized protein LOC143203124 n=1 Tax=Rhynchophorus ferrugineus TaxID=354439 RepID=UPI003FCCAF98
MPAGSREPLLSFDSSTLKPCKNNGRVYALTAATDSLPKDYFVITAGKVNSVQRKNRRWSVLLQLTTSDDEPAVAFEKKSNVSSPAFEATDFDILDSILEALAKHQAKILNSPANLIDEEDEELFNDVYNTQYINEADKTMLDYVLQRLSKDLTVNMKDGLIVDSVGCPLITIPNHKKCLTRLSPVYDALLYLFSLTDENFRQYHFVPLIQSYFHTLRSALDQRLSDKITKEYEETTVRALLPIVKAQLVLRNPTWDDLTFNFRNYLKYPLINQEDVYEILKKTFENQQYEFVKYQVQYLEQKNGHLGEYFFLDIVVKVNGEERELNLFVKVLITPIEVLQKTIKEGIAEKEDLFYNTLLPLFEENNLGELVDFTARCYLSRTNWMLVLSNMSKKGFKPVSINSNLDYHGLRSGVVVLAKLTALSLILEEILSLKQEKPIRLGDIYPLLYKEFIFVNEESHFYVKHLKSVGEAMVYLTELFPDISKGVSAEEVSKYLDETFTFIFEVIRTSKKFRNVIVHGDLYLGNMLFRYGKDGLIDRCALVDLQGLRYMPPAYELLFFLYLSSTRETRLQHYDQLIEEYYQTISRTIDSFDFDPEKLFPKQSFHESLEYMKPAALYVKISYNVISKISSEMREALFHNEEEFNKCFQASKRDFIDMVWADEYYRQAMADNVRDLVDLMSVERHC